MYHKTQFQERRTWPTSAESLLAILSITYGRCHATTTRKAQCSHSISQRYLASNRAAFDIHVKAIIVYGDMAHLAEIAPMLLCVQNHRSTIYTDRMVTKWEDILEPLLEARWNSYSPLYNSPQNRHPYLLPSNEGQRHLGTWDSYSPQSQHAYASTSNEGRQQLAAWDYIPRQQVAYREDFRNPPFLPITRDPWEEAAPTTPRPRNNTPNHHQLQSTEKFVEEVVRRVVKRDGGNVNNTFNIYLGAEQPTTPSKTSPSSIFSSSPKSPFSSSSAVSTPATTPSSSQTSSPSMSQPKALATQVQKHSPPLFKLPTPKVSPEPKDLSPEPNDSLPEGKDSSAKVKDLSLEPKDSSPEEKDSSFEVKDMSPVPSESSSQQPHTLKPFTELESIRTVNEETKKLILKNLLPSEMPDPENGRIYLYLFPEDCKMRSPPIKIGNTNNFERRVRRWETRCGYKPQHLANYECSLYKKIERVILKNLVNNRLKEEECVSCGRKHMEWFRCSVMEAEETAALWIRWSRLVPYAQTGELKQEWVKKLEDLDMNDPTCWRHFITS